jgi:hypothetical protein
MLTVWSNVEFLFLTTKFFIGFSTERYWISNVEYTLTHAVMGSYLFPLMPDRGPVVSIGDTWYPQNLRIYFNSCQFGNSSIFGNKDRQVLFACGGWFNCLEFSSKKRLKSWLITEWYINFNRTQENPDLIGDELNSDPLRLCDSEASMSCFDLTQHDAECVEVPFPLGKSRPLGRGGSH